MLDRLKTPVSVKCLDAKSRNPLSITASTRRPLCLSLGAHGSFLNNFPILFLLGLSLQRIRMQGLQDLLSGREPRTTHSAQNAFSPSSSIKSCVTRSPMDSSHSVLINSGRGADQQRYSFARPFFIWTFSVCRLSATPSCGGSIVGPVLVDCCRLGASR
jgi:hypothetical protein